jgi:hypothetical protein
VPVIRDHLVPAIRDHLVPWLQKMNTWIGDNVVPKLKELWGWIQKNVLPVLKEFGAKVEEFVKNFLPGLNKSLGDNSKQLKDVGRFLTELVGIIVKYVLPIIGGIFLSQLYLVKFAIQGIITVIGAVTRAIEYLWAHRGDILNFLKDLGSKLLEVPKMFFQAGIDVVTGIWDGIKSMGGWLWDQITGFFKDNLVNPIKKLLHLGSPSKLFFGYGQDTVQGFIDGVMGKGDAVASALRRTIGVTPPPGLGAGGQGGTPANIQNIFNLTGPSVAELAAQVSREMAWAQGA